MSVGLRLLRNCSDNFANDKIFVDKLQEYKGYLLDCNYEEEQVNRAFFKASELRGIRHLKSNKKWIIRVNQKLTLSQIMTRGFPISIGFSVNINISLRTTINVEFYFHRTVLGSHIGEDTGTLKNGSPQRFENESSWTNYHFFTTLLSIITNPIIFLLFIPQTP